MFRVGDIIVDHIQFGTFLTSEDEIVYVLSQLSDATISITGESVDVTDARGNRVARIFQSKSGEFTATNAFISEPLMASKAGRDPELATSASPITMPRIQIVKAGETAVLTGFDKDKHHLSVVGADNTYSVSNTTYTLGTTASATEYSIDASKKFTPPTNEDDELYILKYDRDVTSGVKIVNSADDMPSSGKLLLRVLVLDPCDQDTVTAAYFEAPSFTPSPDMELNISGGDTQGMDYSGTLNTKYCDSERPLLIYYRADSEAK